MREHINNAIMLTIIATCLFIFAEWMSARNGALMEVAECMGEDRSREAFDMCADIVRSRHD